MLKQAVLLCLAFALSSSVLAVGSMCHTQIFTCMSTWCLIAGLISLIYASFIDARHFILPNICLVIAGIAFSAFQLIHVVMPVIGGEFVFVHPHDAFVSFLLQFGIVLVALMLNPKESYLGLALGDLKYLLVISLLIGYYNLIVLGAALLLASCVKIIQALLECLYLWCKRNISLQKLLLTSKSFSDFLHEHIALGPYLTCALLVVLGVFSL